MYRLIGILFLVFVPFFSQAENVQSLKNLLDEVKASASQEAQRNKEREAMFRAEQGEQQALMAAAEAEVAKQEELRDSLKKTFDENEVVLGELQDLLDRRSGDLGELFGVFRQTADDAETVIFSSLISLEKPERKKLIESLAESAEIPTIDQIRSLWQLLIEEAALSAELTRFNHAIIDPDGTSYDAEVLRVGSFNVVSDDKYLNYLAEDGSLVELARQPAGSARNSAKNLSSAGEGEQVSFTVDPSRGALLGLLVQSPSLVERIEQGGTVGYAIIALAVIGLLIVLERILRLMRIKNRMSRQLKNLEKVIRDMAEIRKGLPIVKVLAAVAPLMGLLGTVVGMIGTFQAITLFGTGDPKLMAGGISQAARATQIGKIISEQAAGLMAKKAEADALEKGAL